MRRLSQVIVVLFLFYAPIMYAEARELEISGHKYDDEEQTVHGFIEVNETCGDGYIQDKTGRERYITVEWTEIGDLEGYDERGVRYYLEETED